MTPKLRYLIDVRFDEPTDLGSVKARLPGMFTPIATEDESSLLLFGEEILHSGQFIDHASDSLSQAVNETVGEMLCTMRFYRVADIPEKIIRNCARAA